MTDREVFKALFEAGSEGSALPTRRGRRRKRNRPKRLMIVFAVVVLVLGGGSWALWAGISGNGVFVQSGKSVEVNIPQGTSGREIANILQKAGVLNSTDAFYNLLLNRNITLRSGNYQLKTGLDAEGALAAMQNPQNRSQKTVTIVEGTILKKALEVMAEKTGLPLNDFERAASDLSQYKGLPPQAKSLEGFIFPATYDIPDGITAAQLLQTAFKRTLQALSEARVSRDKIWSTIILASIVQKEGSGGEDYPKVARVFENRLQQNMRLQSDATVVYGTGGYGTVETTDAQRADASNVYNTYQHNGLPPGPISNPGFEAIESIIKPANGPWIFFVTVNECTGETRFSTTLAEHQANVNEWLRWRQAHGNRSCAQN